MSLTSRPYVDDGDARRLVDLVERTTSEGAPYNLWYIGDVLWGLYRSTAFDPQRHIRLWEDQGGVLRGFAWFYPPREVAWHIHPRLPDDTLDDEMLAWAEEHLLESGQGGEDVPTLRTTAMDGDERRIAFLERHGFVPGNTPLVHMVRGLDAPIPEPDPPEGATVRHVGGEHEFDERVAIHREVWHPSKLTLDAYRRLRLARGYLPELDIVAATPDGTHAAYCICWLDTVNGIGEFEPVGTRPAFRGRGYGKAVMLEGLRRLRAHGATSAVVLTHESNAAAIRLYESTGFRIHTKERDYVKTL